MNEIFNPYCGFLVFLGIMIIFFFSLWLIFSICDDILSIIKKWCKNGKNN